MVRLLRHAKLSHLVPVDRLHHAHAREDHRAIGLRGLGHQARGVMASVSVWSIR
jgi:hypothetical protein